MGARTGESVYRTGSSVLAPRGPPVSIQDSGALNPEPREVCVSSASSRMGSVVPLAVCLLTSFLSGRDLLAGDSHSSVGGC